ncbi:MAG: GGDEF domain-containing phosphodiesterase [Lachnospiraceae bacterium]|nr:GGDEF domain-containing phosphodiesterase [Lachnospiraceae bacterium]
MDKYEYSKETRKLLESALIPFAIYQFVNKRVVTLILSDGFLKLFDYEDREKAYYDMDNNMYIDSHPDDAARIADAAFRFATEGEEYDVIYRSGVRHGKGDEYRIIHAHGEHFKTDTGIQLAQVWYIDEGVYKADGVLTGKDFAASLNENLRRESIVRISYYDYLTGLPSMTYFFELAEAGCRDMLNRGSTPAFIFLDLSGMKHYNQKHGFANGDKLLRAFAELIVRYFSNENCSRFSQDHFAVFSENDGIEDKLHQIFREWQRMNISSLPIRAGVYYPGTDKIDISTACDRAKIACDSLRNTYVSDIHYFNKAMEENVERRQYFVTNLDRAIEEKWITVYYQPIIRSITGRVCDEEALARWIDPKMGFLSPADFIPILEDAELVYKLDLYVLDQVLDKIRVFEEEGLHIVPQSINLSRTDFEACDIVSEIVKRVDNAGVSHDKITIEITESAVGSNFEFMKEQIERFRRLGFPVWMDDFGSGYSSLDVLKQLKFDLIKFDMRFLKDLDKGENGRIILTELMRMTTALGIDTVCEGVETEENAVFLREIGCSKLQGYFYEKPIPMEKVLDKYRRGVQIGFENSEEESYYETVGRLNLFDIIGNVEEKDTSFKGYFNTLPVAVMEIKDETFRITRANRSYRDFALDNYDNILDNWNMEFVSFDTVKGDMLRKILEQTDDDHDRIVLKEKLPSNRIFHAFIRRIAVNRVTGTVAFAVAILAITDETNRITYSNIAKSLAANYFMLYYVNIETEDFIIFSSEEGKESMALEKRDTDFFEKSRIDAVKYVYQDDLDGVLSAFTKENIIRSLNEQGSFTLTYRMNYDKGPAYVNMKIAKVTGFNEYIIIAISNIDLQMQKQKLYEKMLRESIVYSRISALVGEYICMYAVNLDTEYYIECTSNKDFKDYGLAEHGEDFFKTTREKSRNLVYKDDLERFIESFTKEKVLETIREKGKFEIKYRLMFDGKPKDVTLRAVLTKENDGDKLIVGIV